MAMITERGEMSVESLGEQICEMAGHFSAAMCRWLLLVGEFDRREGWAADGVSSCAQWVSWRCGVAYGTARDQVRVARKLSGLPVIAGRFATGELSYAKVRALVRIATPDTEGALVELGLEATAYQLEEMVREFKRSEREALGEQQRRRSRCYVRHRYDLEDGAMIITARLEPQDGALVMDLLEDLVRLDPADPAGPADTAEAGPETPGGVSAETPPADLDADDRAGSSPAQAARVGALVAMARRAATTLGDDVVVAADRSHLLVHLNVDSMPGQPPGCHLHHGPRCRS